MSQMFRITFSNYNKSKTEFIKKEFETVCNDVIDIHPYEEMSKLASEGQIEPLPEPQAFSSSSGLLTNNQLASSSAVEEQHTV